MIIIKGVQKVVMVKNDIQEMIVEEEKDMIELENPQVYQAVKDDVIETLPWIGKVSYLNIFSK